MATNLGLDQEQAAPDAASTARLLTVRRRLLRGGVGAAPVALSLSSASVMGGTCRGVSAFGSLRPSSKAGTPCTGSSPVFWQANSFPAGCVKTGATATNFGAPVAPSTTGAGFSLGPPPIVAATTLQDVLTSGTTVAKAFAAAFLNNKNGTVPEAILPLGQIQAMWTATKNGGSYQIPTTSVFLTQADVLNYLAQTWT